MSNNVTERYNNVTGLQSKTLFSEVSTYLASPAMTEPRSGGTFIRPSLPQLNPHVQTTSKLIYYTNIQMPATVVNLIRSPSTLSTAQNCWTRVIRDQWEKLRLHCSRIWSGFKPGCQFTASNVGEYNSKLKLHLEYKPVKTPECHLKIYGLSFSPKKVQKNNFSEEKRSLGVFSTTLLCVGHNH